MSLCLTVSLSYCFSVLLFLCLTVSLSYCFSVLLFLCLTVSLSYCLSVFQSLDLSVSLPCCFYVLLLSVSLSLCLSLCLSVCLPVSPLLQHSDNWLSICFLSFLIDATGRWIPTENLTNGRLGKNKQVLLTISGRVKNTPNCITLIETPQVNNQIWKIEIDRQIDLKGKIETEKQQNRETGRQRGREREAEKQRGREAERKRDG